MPDSFRAILVRGWVVAPFTWATVLLELMLSMALLMERRYQRMLLWGGLAMHFGIIFVHGLTSFSTIMSGALLLYLHPWDLELKWPFAVAQRFTAAIDTVVERRKQQLTGVAR